MRRTLSIALLPLLALGACSADSTPVSTSTPTPEVSSSTPTPTPSNQTATVQQYASIVARTKADLDQNLTALESCSPDSYKSDAICMAGLATLGLQAQTLQVSLEGAQKEGVPAYVGPPPAEIAALVTSTQSAATEAAMRVQALSDCQESCVSEHAAYFAARVGLSAELASWNPYGA